MPQAPSITRAPADVTGSQNDLIRHIIPSAALAPSAHNTQPWRFVVTDQKVEFFVAWDRHLNVSDPSGRQLFVSIGCAVANAVAAARYWGYRAHVTYFPEGTAKDQPVARLVVDKAAASVSSEVAELFTAIAHRRTDRSLYDGQPLTPEERDQLMISQDVIVIDDRATTAAIGKLTEEGTYATLSRSDFKTELSHWVRNSWTRQSDGMPGYAMGMPAPVSLVASLVVRLAPIHKQEGPKTRQEIESTSSVAVITTPHDTPADWLAAGEALENLWLSATAAGLAAMPLAAAIEGGQSLRTSLQRLLGTPKLPQAILRIGHSQQKTLKPTPRRSVEDCLR